MVVTRVAIRFRTAIFVLVGNLVLAGLMSFYGMPREMFPDIEIPVVVVSVPYPGASPTDVEQLILTPLETELKGVKNIDKLKGTAYEGAAVVSLEFVPEANIDEALQAVRDRVSRVKPKLPADILDPSVSEVSFSDFPILIVNVSAPYALDRLEAFAERLEEAIEGVPGVLSADVSGGLEGEVRVEVDPEAAAASGVSLGDIVNAIRSENVNLPGGVLEADTTSWLLRTPADIRRAEQLQQIVIKEKNGHPIRLSDVARVERGFEKRQSYARINGRTAVSLNITKRTGANIVEVVDAVKAIVDELGKEAPTGTEIKLLQDQSVRIRQMIDDLVNNIITALVLVIAVLFFFMGARNATLVSLAVPLSMLLTFVTLDAMGVTLNMVTLFSLILALGMLVDNAIVIIENIYRHLGERVGPEVDGSVFRRMRVVASYTGTAEVAWPVIASTATTVAAFAPLLFWPGIMGKFMGYLPLVVIITLVSSLIVGLLINPVTAAVFMARPSGEGAPEATDDRWEEAYRGPMSRVYGWILRSATSYRREGMIGPLVTVVISFATLVFSIMAYAGSGNGVEFFPETTPERATIAVTAPNGTSLDGSDRIVRQIEAVLLGEANVKDFVATPGMSAGAGPGQGGTANTHLSGLSIDFQKEEDRVESTLLTIDRMRQAFLQVAGARIEVNREKMGPPAGAPIQVELVGNDYEVLGRLSDRLLDILRDMQKDGVADPKSDFVTGRPEVAVVVDRQAAREVGASTSAVASTVRNAFNGTESSVIRNGTDETDIVVRYRDGRRDTTADLGAVRVPGKNGTLVPLDQLAKVVRSAGAGTIRHSETRRVVTVQADVAGGANANKLRKELAKRIDAELRMPAGTSWRYGGENVEQQKASAFLGRALLIGLFGILIILVAQFNSVLKPVIIMSSVVLSLVGVFAGLVITGKPFGVVMTGLGVISLAGVVVNNAIVLIDFIESLRTAGLGPHEAVLRAGLVRLRPVLLTALTTVLGLIPMATGINVDFLNLRVTETGSSGEFWGGMAIAVSFGLVFATVLTLVVVPALYLVLDRIGSRTRKILFGSDETIDIDAELAREDAAPVPAAPPAAASSSLGGAAATVLALALVGAATLSASPALAQAASANLALAEPDGAPEELTLQAALERLDKQGPDLAVARARLEASQLIVDRAWSALHPIITASGTYSLNDPVMELSFGDPEALRSQAQAQIDGHIQSLSAVRAQMAANGENTQILDGAIAQATKARDDMPLPQLETVQINRRHGLNAQLRLQMSLYDARTLTGLDMARTSARLARQNLALTRNGLRMAVARAFCGAVVQRESLAVLQRRLDAARRELETVQKQAEAGVGTPLSRKMAELRVLQAERAVLAGRLGLEAAVASLGMLIGADKRFVLVGGVEPTLPTGEVAKLVRDAIARRPELRMMREQQKLAEMRVSETRKRWLPRLSLSGQTQWSNAAGFGGQNVTSALMITVTQQIWDGGASSLDHREASANLRIAAVETQKIERRIAAEVRGSLLAVQRAGADIDTAQRAVDVSSAAVQDAIIGRKVGTNTELEQLGLEDRLVEAELGVVQARVARSMAVLDVRSALGLPPL
ncbi:MAG: hypothetical protein RIT45_2704 [Pseudomonadota bacterium]